MSLEEKIAEARDAGREARRDDLERMCSYNAVSLRDAWFAGWDAEDERRKLEGQDMPFTGQASVPDKREPFFEINTNSHAEPVTVAIRGSAVVSVENGSIQLSNGMLYFVNETREQILRLIKSCKGGF